MTLESTLGSHRTLGGAQEEARGAAREPGYLPLLIVLLPRFLASGDAPEEIVVGIEPLLTPDACEASVFAVLACCIGALRTGMTPREWLTRFARHIPNATNEARDIGTLASNPEAVVTMARAAMRVKYTLSTQTSRDLSVRDGRHPYTKVFDKSARDSL